MQLAAGALQKRIGAGDYAVTTLPFGPNTPVTANLPPSFALSAPG
jgi:hypothetical protein